MVRVSQGYSDQFEVSVGVHQGSVLSPLLFVSVMEVLVREVREGLPWEVLYADDLVLVAESMEGLERESNRVEELHGGEVFQNECGQSKSDGVWRKLS
jgi:hypothetical protein